MGELESALATIEAEIASAQKIADELTAALKRARKAAQAGRIADLERTLPLLAAKGEAAAATARELPGKWSFDAKSYLDGGFLAELREAAASASLDILEKDGRLYAFPLALRVDRGEVAVRVGKKAERGIRPSALAKLLAAIQKRPLRFSEQRFLDLLHKTYERMAGREWQTGRQAHGPVIPLADIHAVLTLLPGSDYSIEEFGRDLLLLDRKPDLRTREGHRLAFAGSAMARVRSPIKVYDESGREQSYLGISFAKEP